MRAPLEADSVQKRIAAAEAELEGRGRLVIRKSGTEPLIRVMAEGDDPRARRSVWSTTFARQFRARREPFLRNCGAKR